MSTILDPLVFCVDTMEPRVFFKSGTHWSSVFFCFETWFRACVGSTTHWFAHVLYQNSARVQCRCRVRVTSSRLKEVPVCNAVVVCAWPPRVWRMCLLTYAFSSVRVLRARALDCGALSGCGFKKYILCTNIYGVMSVAISSQNIYARVTASVVRMYGRL